MLVNLDEKYDLAEELGQGATAIVYSVIDRALKRSVALKQMRLAKGISQSAQKELVARFLQEGQTLARLSHAHIPKVLEIGTWKTSPAIIMEQIQGEKLYDSLQRQPQIGETLNWLAQIADALHYAHCQGIVHRDLKPENIIVTPNRGAFLMDFGVARQEESVLQTSDGTILGTIAYMSPEQLYNSAKADARCDIYSLGVVMYEVFTGQLPYDGESPAAMILKIFNSDPKPPLEVEPNLPKGLADLIQQCLHKDPQSRVQTAKQVAYTLIQLANSDADKFSKLPEKNQTQIGLSRQSSSNLEVKQTIGELVGLRLSKESVIQNQIADHAKSLQTPQLEPDGVFSNYGLFVALAEAYAEGFSGAIKVKAHDQKNQAYWFKGVIWLGNGKILHAQLIREQQPSALALRELLKTASGKCQKTPNIACPSESFSQRDDQTILKNVFHELGLKDSSRLTELFEYKLSDHAEMLA